MAGFTPYFVGNLRLGTELGVQPWLLPQDAFTKLENCHMYRGVLRTRLGMELFGTMTHQVTDEAVGALGTDHYTGTLAEAPILAGTAVFTDGALEATDDGVGEFTGDATGTINYTTGDYDITFSGNTTDAVVVSYEFPVALPIVGIEPHHDSQTGASELVVINTRRASVYDVTTSRLLPIDDSDIWTGTSANLIWGANYQDRLFLTNNLDRVKSYDGTNITDLMMDIDGDAANEVNTCLMLFQYKERLVALSTKEDDMFYPQRARWCVAGDPDDWTNDGFVDCPTHETIVCADFIKDDLVVFFQQSTWRLRYTGDADLPFRWESVLGYGGSYGSYSGFVYESKFGAVGETSITETDGVEVYSADTSVPDAVVNMDVSLFNRIYAIPISELQQVLISYPTVGATENDKTLVFNYRDKCWSEYDYGFNCYGFYKLGTASAFLDSLEDIVETLDYSFDDSTMQAGYPATLAGDLAGSVWLINSTGADNGSPIALDIRSGRWNPFISQGRQARLGWVDLFVTNDPDIEITVSFFVNHESTAHMSQVVQCGEDVPSVEDSKVWVRVNVDVAGDFHQMRIYHTAAEQRFELHAINAWFKPAGPIKGY